MLKSISSMDQLHDLITAFKTKYKTYHTNLLLPHDRLENLIKRDKVLYHDGKSCLSFIIKQYHTNMLYYYVNELSNIETSFDEKPLFIEFFLQSDKPESWSHNLEKNGFRKHSSHIRMFASPQSVKIPEYIDEKRFKIISEMDIELYKEILFANFDLVSDRLPEEWEYDDFARMTMHQVIDTDNNKVPGFITYSIHNKMSIGEYMHVDDDYRGLGLGKRLYSCYLENTIHKVKRYINWVHPENSVAISMYLSMGYTHDTLRKELYVKN